MSLDRSKYIAVSGYNRNTHETSIDVYSFFSSDFRNKPKLLFSIEFEKYVSKGMVYRGRLVSFGPSDGDIVTCLCDSLEIIQNKNVQSSYRRVNGNASCMFVTQNEIFISFYKSRHVTVYDNKQLNVINQINLGGIEEGYFPFDIVAVHGKLYTCVGEDSPGSYSKALSIGEQNGTNLSEFTNSTGEHWYANSIAVNLQLSVVVVVWFSSYYIRQGTRFQIMFYALTNQNYSSFLIVEDESVSRIRLSDTGDRIFTGNQVTGEVKMYDMAEVFTYDELKNYLASELRGDDCVRLSDYFALPKDQRDDILRSTTPTHYLLLALEERCITHPSSVERLTEAFKALQINPACCTVTEIYQKTRMQATIYNRLLATLSAHLTASVREASFRYFKLSDVEKNRITNSQNPGLSLLLTLHELGVIGPSQLVTLTQHFSDQRLVQAVAKIQEYLSVLTEIRNQSLEKSELTYQDKLTLFIRRLKEKIKSWYETMTPVPWKMSCRWKSSELFVGSGLILTDSKTKGSLPSIDEKCKLEYTEIFSHENLESESRIILEGDPGSGKTMLMSQLAYDWAVGKFSEIEILILVPLKFVKDRTLVQAIEEFYLQDESRLTRQDIELFLQNSVSSIHLLLDGLEECTGSANSSGQSDIMKIILKEKYHRCKAVITTRSEFVENLPKSPLVKLGQFGDKERNLYIEKVFADNIDGQKKAKEIMINLPFMLTLCSTPVLFVMVVHNIECMSRSDGDQFQCVSPFIQRILNILCSSWVPTNKTEWPSDRPFEDLCDRNAFAALGTADKGTAKPKSLGTIGHEKVVNSSKKTKHALWKDIPSAECKSSSAIKAMGGSKFYKYSKELLIEPQPDSERSDTTVDSQSAFVGIQHGPSITLEELAFNGLCHGIQQLSWQKGFLERNVINSRHWIESGVIVTEEGHIPLSNFDQNKSEREGLEVKSEPESQGRDDFNTRQNEINMVQDNTGTSLSQTAKSVKKLKSPRVKSQTREGKGNFVKRDLESNSESSDDSDSTTESYINVPSMNDSNSSSGYASETRKSKDTEAKTQTVLAQVQYKFLHKVIQEWFAAKNLSFLLWKSVPSNRLQECLKETLQHISPADLHYILRFTCYLCPPSYRFMVKYLLQNYRSQSIYIPVYIMDCIFLCYAEYNGEESLDIIEIVEEICKEVVTITSKDSKLLQEAKTDILDIASKNLISIRKLVLSDAVVAARKDALTLNSGVEMKALHSLKMIKLDRWDQTLQDEDYLSILKFISNCYSVQTAELHLPHQPPELDEATVKSLQINDTKVTWSLGSKMAHKLNTRTGKWTMIPNTAEGVAMDQKRLNEDDDGKFDIRNSLYTEKIIDEKGGTLFLNEADISMHIPVKALAGSHLLSIMVPLDPSVYYPSSDIFPRFTPLIICKPDNILFKQPVKLTLPHCAVIKNPNSHKIVVKFGQKVKKCSKDMKWTSESVDYSLGEHYCTIYLYHFSGVDVVINSAEEKILRVIPYTKIGHGNKQVLSVWLCNDLESDFQSVIQAEETNEGIPLDSYDTFRLRCVPGQADANVKFNLEALEGSNWRPEEVEDVIDVNRLSAGTKSKCNFRLIGGKKDDECYMYFFLRVTQVVEDKKRETTFALRKRICDLQMPVMFKKPYSSNGQQAAHIFQTENLPRICTAVVYMDPVKDVNDDAIITLWLLPFDSATKMFQFLQQEQELQLKHRVDTENSFSIFDENIAVVTKTTFRNGHWLLSPKEKKIETDRIRYGSRVKFQFIGQRKEQDDSTYIDLQVETFQEEKNKIKFMTDVEIIRLLYAVRRKDTEGLKISVKEELYNVSEKDKTSVLCTHMTTVNKELTQQAAATNAHLSQDKEYSVISQERLQNCFLSLKKNLAGDWKDFGRYLSLSDDELNRISKDNKDDVGEKIYQMLLTWQRRKGSEATCEKLIEKLKKLDRRDLAEKLQGM